MNIQSICRGAAHFGLIGALWLFVDGTAIAQDAVAGKKAFAQCSVCHSTDGTNGVGPTLQGIVDSKAGEVPGFRFSRAMKASNIMWDDKSLDAYLVDPQKTIPGNVMPFSGLADATERADLIAYLKTLK
jgi:cytochrome c